jgi:hypothetical protein
MVTEHEPAQEFVVVLLNLKTAPAPTSWAPLHGSPRKPWQAKVHRTTRASPRQNRSSGRQTWCHFSPYNVPVVFTQIAPGALTENVPGVLTQHVPAVCGQDGPPHGVAKLLEIGYPSEKIHSSRREHDGKQE